MSRLSTALRSLRPGRRLAVVVAVVATLAAGVTTAAVAAGGDSGTRHLTAYFTKTIGLYQGNDVRVLGVRIGQIDKLTVDGTRVRVDMSYDGKYKLPLDVKAVLVPPSVVSDRFIQLAPAYTGGPVLPDHQVLNTDRTVVPLEFDEIFRNLDQMNNALGPNGANRYGALSRLVDVSAKNLDGNGEALNGALKEFSAAISTVAGSRTDLFATVRNLQQFSSMLAQNDGGVRALNANLARVGTQLAGERRDLGAALANLSTALQLISQFVGDNRTRLTSDIHKLTKVTSVLSREKEALTEVVDMAPFALSNLALAGDTKAHTLDTKDESGQPFSNPTGPNGVLCQLLGSAFCVGASSPAFGHPQGLSGLLGVGG
ncbi:MAG TPA: MCE family protein [Mycobacteriales bacterium]|nr:MCE family protein [Mycobacteriales bacterium]